MMVLQIIEELRSRGHRGTCIVPGRRGKTSGRVRCRTTVQKVVDLSVRMKNVRFDAKACVHPLSTSNVSLEADSSHIIDRLIACVHARVIDPIDRPIFVDRGSLFPFRSSAVVLFETERADGGQTPTFSSFALVPLHCMDLGMEHRHVFFFFRPVIPAHWFPMREPCLFLRSYSHAWDGWMDGSKGQARGRFSPFAMGSLGCGAVLSFRWFGAPSLVGRDRGPGVDFFPSFLSPPSIVGLDPSDERRGGWGETCGASSTGGDKGGRVWSVPNHGERRRFTCGDQTPTT